MRGAITDLDQLLVSMEPVLNSVEAAFVFIPQGDVCPFDLSSNDVIGLFREAEGLTVIVAATLADSAGIPVVLRCAWITLSVHSDLAAVGLTAAFAHALAAENVSCNVVAGVHHDHIFVPLGDAGRAMAALYRLQAQGLRT